MQQKIRNWVNAYLPPFLWAGVIYYFSAQAVLPSFEVSTLDFIFKKFSHMFVYGVLYFLLYRGINLQQTQLKQKNWILPFFISLLYAISDELHQAFTPNRSPSPRDLIFDSLGMTIVFLRLYAYI